MHLPHPPTRLVHEACREIVRQGGGNDLSAVTVLLPDLHAAAEVARTLQAAAQTPVLLPRLTTLRQWAADVPLPTPVTPAAAREAAIYHALAQRRWLQDQDLWSVAAELSTLFDELTRWHIGMPSSPEDFVFRLERAYEARAGATFAFEARLVHALWHALGSGAPDPEAAYQLRLGELAHQVTGPVHALGLGPLAPAEEAFLARCAERVPVVRFEADGSRATCDPFERTLHLAWSEPGLSSLSERAQVLRGSCVEPALRGRLRFFGAPEAEEHAEAVAASVLHWLQTGRQRIAVIALDRLVARRARALLERAQVLVRDEAGWPLSTTSAATVIGRWFDLAGNDAYHRDLLDLLKSPFAFADWPRPERRRTVWRLERALRHASIRSGLERYLSLARASGDAALERMLERVRRGLHTLARSRRKPLASWVGGLQASLDEIGVRRGLDDDAAGVQILELLAELAAELGSDRTPIDFGEFRRWLARRLEAASFRDAGIESPVVFTSLQATRLRRFDAVLVMGADAARLPGGGAPQIFFNQRVRRELGLPGAVEHDREVREALSGVLSRSGETLVTWQRASGGEPNLISPLFERLRTLHTLAWGDALDDVELPMRIERLRRREQLGPGPSLTTPPAPHVPPERLPRSISASGYNALLACPYQFYARYGLGLRESDEVQEALEKADYGVRVHEILTRFHRLHPSALALAPDEAIEALHEVSEEVFGADIEQNYTAAAWLARWRAIVPGYIAWQRARETAGWRFHGGELERSVRIDTPGGRTFVLHGRIDRVDVHADGKVGVVDYKTRPRNRLREELSSPGEDVQLPVYALLWGEPVAEAAYLPIDTDEVVALPLEHDVGTHAAEVRARLTALVDRIGEGAPLPAQGIETVCSYCEMGGLCRRKHWA